MGFLDQIKQALAKKHSAQHPEGRQSEQDKTKINRETPAGKSKPQKKVTGRGR